MQEVQAASQLRSEPVGYLHQDSHVLGHDEVLVSGAAVAQVVAQLDIFRNQAANSCQFVINLLLVVRRTVSERLVVFENQYLLADIPLNGQPVVGYGVHYSRDRVGQSPFVGRQIGGAGVRADVHVSRGHRGRHADLKADICSDHLLVLEPGEDLIRLHCGIPVSGVESSFRRVGPILELHPLGLPNYFAVPLDNLEGLDLRVHFHVRMIP